MVGHCLALKFHWPHWIAVEVGLVSHKAKNNWLVFEVEIDENTQIHHESIIIFLRVTSNVSAAANSVLKLPEMPEQQYS